MQFMISVLPPTTSVIPVMLMGKFLKGTKYPYVQYVEATFITIGVAIFSLASKVSIVCFCMNSSVLHFTLVHTHTNIYKF